MTNETKKDQTKNNQAMAFSFGDPETVLTTPLVDYYGLCYDHSGGFYVPPVPQSGLAKIMNANAHHCSAIHFKKNLLCKWYEPSPQFPLKEFRKFAFESYLLGQAYLQRLHNSFGQEIGVRHVPGISMRRLKQSSGDADQYALTRPGKEDIKFKPGEIVHFKNYDPLQTIYGIPEYLGGLQSILLNENATLFRRRYYENGNHAGFVFYMADPDLGDDTKIALEEAITGTKGPGNFRSLFINVPKGREKSVQILPVGDTATKDDFERIKNVTRNDILSVHRIHRDLAAVMPQESGGGGDIEKISRVNYENEIVPLQQALKEINDDIKTPIVFREPSFADAVQEADKA